MSSVQLLTYLHRRHVEGLSQADAAFEAGLSTAEAKLTDADVARGVLAVPEAAALPLRSAARPATVTTEPAPSRLLDAITPIQPEENIMARPKKVEQTSIEVKQPDYARAVRLYRGDIKPAVENAGKEAQTASTAYKAIEKECFVNRAAAKLAFRLAEQSEEKRDDFLRSLRGLLTEMNIGITSDLVSRAEGEDVSAPIIPAAKPERPALVTVN